MFFFLPGLNSGGRLGSRAIYDVPDFFLLKHGLSEISPLEPVFEASKLFFFLQLSLLVVILSKREEK